MGKHRNRPLEGVRVLELAGLAPAPFCGLILADFGADVVRVDRLGVANLDFLSRGKRSIAIDFKKPEGIALLKHLAQKADVLIDPFRPGVLERLGLGPNLLTSANPRLIVARLTGFGQTGMYAKDAGHDINYIAVSGALSFMGRADESPMFPVNLLGDFAGGGLMCAFGIVTALFERGVSGKGQVIDAAMVDGSAYLGSFLFNMRNRGIFAEERGKNPLDSGAPFYEIYRTKDNKFMAVGAIETPFYACLLKGLGLSDATDLPEQNDTSAWPEMKKRFAAIFAQKTRAEWEQIFNNTDACVTPVLEADEVFRHPYMRERNLVSTFHCDEDGKIQEIAPAPKLSRTPAFRKGNLPKNGYHTWEVLHQAGITPAEIEQLVQKKVVNGITSSL